MSGFRARLARAQQATGAAAPLILDGGMGSMLIARGLARGEPPERWNLDRPDDIVAVHRAYVAAGSEAVHANTFGGNPIRLAAFGLADQCETINRSAIEIARRADPPFVIADVGPTGEYLPPVGKGDESQWHEAFAVQGRFLAAAGADALHVETMTDLREATAALDALRQAAPELPIMVSLTFDRKKRGFFTIMGNPLIASLAELARRGADAVGANCSLTSDVMGELVTAARSGLGDEGLGVALCAQANAGQPQVTPEGVHYAQSPDAFAEDTAQMARDGATIVGGCCGTDPAFIRALCQRLAEPATDRAGDSS